MFNLNFEKVRELLFLEYAYIKFNFCYFKNNEKPMLNHIYYYGAKHCQSVPIQC